MWYLSQYWNHPSRKVPSSHVNNSQSILSIFSIDFLNTSDNL